MEFSRKKNFFAVFILSLPFLLYFCFVPVSPKILDSIDTFNSKYQHITGKVYTENFVYNTTLVANLTNVSDVKNAPEKLENPPEIIKAIYMTGWSAGSKSYRNYLNKIIETTQINAVVIDIKDYSGIVSYRTNAKLAKAYNAYYPQIPDIDELVNDLHKKGIYVIARIAVFQDPILAKNRQDLAVYDKSKTQDSSRSVLWEDRKGLYWVDPASDQVHDYNIAIAKDAESHGFDEINFDYIRFPTDGKISNMGFPVWDGKTTKNYVIRNFFKKLEESFPNTKISVDIFGQTTVDVGDIGIGQILEDAFEYFDYVCPMVYPSHYVSGFIGYKNPAEKPYEVIRYSLDRALARQQVYNKLKEIKTKNEIQTNSTSLKQVTTTEVPAANTSEDIKRVQAKIRPWIQDFNLGAQYDSNMILQEIKAVYDSLGEDFNGFMLWNPSNVYTNEAVIKGGFDPSLVKPK